MAETWFTADLHLSHERIVELCARPFDGTDQMNEEIVRRWNDAVGPFDTVWVLGDVALGPVAESLPTVLRLNGTKVLVAGNHDRCWEGNSRVRAVDVARYYEAGFVAVAQRAAAAVGGEPVVLSHFPYAGDSHDTDRYAGHRPADDGGWVVHGHVHERFRQRGRQVNVGVDAWDFRPVHETQVAALIERGPADLAPLPTTPAPARARAARH